MKYIFYIFAFHFFCFNFGIVYTQEKNQPNSFTENLVDSSLVINQIPRLTDIHRNQPTAASSQQKYRNEFLISNDVNYQRLALASSLILSLNYAAYQPFKDAWWEEERTNFHFYRGWRRNKGYWDFGWNDTLYGHLDKLGHYYSAKLLSEQLFYISRWIGFSEGSSKFIGPIVSSLLMLEIEIYDGFFKNWGFSLADFAANELGAFSPLIAEEIPFLNNFQLKLSYNFYRQPENESTFINDYAGMTYWLSFKIQSALPEKIKKYSPPWLNLSLGYSVSKPTRGEVELFISPDIDWTHVPLGRSATMKFLKSTLNYFHFPCFAFKLTPKKKFYPLYF